MNIQEVELQRKRLDKYALLQAAADELSEALAIIDSQKDNYTGNASRVVKVSALSISFGNVTDTILLERNRICGWQISSVLSRIFDERRKLIWDEMEKL